MGLVASVDYPNKRIYLSNETINTEIDTLNVYTEVRALRRTTETHRKFKPIIIGGGNIQKTVTTYTPAYVQLLYGCRLVPFDTSHALCLCRETFTDDGFTGRDVFDRSSLSPTTAVDIDVNVLEVEIREVQSSGLTGEQEAQLAYIEDTRNAMLGDSEFDEGTGVLTVKRTDDTTLAQYQMTQLNGKITKKEQI